MKASEPVVDESDPSRALDDGEEAPLVDDDDMRDCTDENGCMTSIDASATAPDQAKHVWKFVEALQ